MDYKNQLNNLAQIDKYKPPYSGPSPIVEGWEVRMKWDMHKQPGCPEYTDIQIGDIWAYWPQIPEMIEQNLTGEE